MHYWFIFDFFLIYFWFRAFCNHPNILIYFCFCFWFIFDLAIFVLFATTPKYWFIFDLFLIYFWFGHYWMASCSPASWDRPQLCCRRKSQARHPPSHHFSSPSSATPAQWPRLPQDTLPPGSSDSHLIVQAMRAASSRYSLAIQSHQGAPWGHYLQQNLTGHSVVHFL